MADSIQQKRPEQADVDGLDRKLAGRERDVEVGAEAVDIDRIEKVYK